MASGRTIYLHIGTEKTGTTTVQAMFSTNRSLLAQAGILYPTTPGDTNHAGLPIYALPQASRPGLYSMLHLFTPAEVEAYRNRFAAAFSAEIERSPCRHIVISSEHLSSRVRHRPAMQQLFGLLGKLAETVKIIVYLRPQHELAPSLYSTKVKSGNSLPFQPPESDENYFYNYDMLTKNWQNQVGRSNLVVRMFSKKSFKNGSLVEDIFDAMALPMPAGLVIPADKNTALSAHALEFLRIANATVPRMLETRINPDHTALVTLLTAMGPSPKFQIDRQTALAIETRFLASNRAVAERYFPDLHGELFPPVRAEDDTILPTTAEDMVRVGVAIWAATRGRAGPARQPPGRPGPAVQSARPSAPA